MPLFRFDGTLGYSVYENQVGALQLGKFSSSTVGYGMPLTKTASFGFRVCSDDKAAVLTSGASIRAAEHRLLVKGVQTGDVSLHGGQDHLKVGSDCSAVTGYMGGTWGYVEMLSGGKVNVCGAVRAQLDCPSGATISGVLSMFLAAAGDIGGTHTGPATVLHVPNPTGGTFDYLAVLGTATGCNITSFAGNGAFVPNNKGTFTQVGQIKIKIGSTDYYIPYGTVA